MTSKELDKLQWLHREIKQLNELSERLESLQCIAESPEFASEQISKYRQLLQSHSKLEKTLSSIENPKLRLIMRYRQFYGLEWDEIGWRLGMDGNAVRQYYHRYQRGRAISN